jgi:uncharacterized membrane protein
VSSTVFSLLMTLVALASAVAFIAYLGIAKSREPRAPLSTFLHYSSSTRWYERVLVVVGLGLDLFGTSAIYQSRTSDFGVIFSVLYFLAPLIVATLFTFTLGKIDDKRRG